MSRNRTKRITLAPVQETVEKIKRVVEEGDYYGAQQMYKSFSSRYASGDRYSDALDILESGACLELDNGQVTCGAELGVLFVEILLKGKFPCDDDTLDRIQKIYKKFPRTSIPPRLEHLEALVAAEVRVESCSSFLKAAIKWSMAFGAHKYGSPELHEMLADYLYAESPDWDVHKVSFHFVRGKSPKKFASTLVNFIGKCHPSEDDLAVARPVLMYLSLGNLRDANILMDELKKQMQFGEVEFPHSDLTQMIIYLLLTLQRDALPLFNILRQRYKSSIDREPLFNELLDEVAEKFYGVRRRNSMSGMFGDIFKIMAGD